MEKKDHIALMAEGALSILDIAPSVARPVFPDRTSDSRSDSDRIADDFRRIGNDLRSTLAANRPTGGNG